MRCIRHSIHCIVPPVVLERIARNGNERQREWAIETMARDHTLRAARIQNLAQRATLRRRPPDVLGAAADARPHRTIRDARNTENLTGPIVRQEGDGPTGDLAVDEAYDGLGETFEYFLSIHARNSIDDEGMPLDAVVHFGEAYDNAFWDGQRMVFGDGDGELFNRFTSSLDVIGHELAHGVTEDELGLIYLGQPGALNESVSDVFGSLIKQYKNQQKAEEADWLIGAELLTPNVQGVALRSMKEPGTAYDDPVLGKDPQPDHMDRYVLTTADNGGVHINSGIPNLAFCTTAMTLGGYAWERAGRIWYATVRDPQLRPTARFRTFARATVRAAQRLYGDGSEEMRAVQAGWDKVGVVL